MLRTLAECSPIRDPLIVVEQIQPTTVPGEWKGKTIHGGAVHVRYNESGVYPNLAIMIRGRQEVALSKFSHLLLDCRQFGFEELKAVTRWAVHWPEVETDVLKAPDDLDPVALEATVVRAQIGDAMTLRAGLVIQWALTHYGQDHFTEAVCEAMFREWPVCRDSKGKVGPDITVAIATQHKGADVEYRLHAIRDTQQEAEERDRQRQEVEERSQWAWAQRIMDGAKAIREGLARGKGKTDG